MWLTESLNQCKNEILHFYTIAHSLPALNLTLLDCHGPTPQALKFIKFVK